MTQKVSGGGLANRENLFLSVVLGRFVYRTGKSQFAPVRGRDKTVWYALRQAHWQPGRRTTAVSGVMNCVRRRRLHIISLSASN